MSIFREATKVYENQLNAVILSSGVVSPGQDIQIARDNYYASLANIKEKISNGTRENMDSIAKDINDIKYLNEVFGEDNNQYSNGAVLSRLLGVKNSDADNPNTVAGLYGGGVEALDDIGFKNADGQTLMMFAGAEGIEGAQDAEFRVYEDGTLHANKGVFSGIITKTPTAITPDNIEKYSTVITETVPGGSGYIQQITNLLDLTKIGSYIIFNYPKPMISIGHTVIDLPYYAESDVGMRNMYNLEDVMPLIGVNILVQFNESSGIDCFGVVTISDDGVAGGQCYRVENGTLFSLTCDAGTYNGEFNIGWKVKQIRG